MPATRPYGGELLMPGTFLLTALRMYYCNTVHQVSELHPRVSEDSPLTWLKYVPSKNSSSCLIIFRSTDTYLLLDHIEISSTGICWRRRRRLSFCRMRCYQMLQLVTKPPAHRRGDFSDNEFLCTWIFKLVWRTREIASLCAYFYSFRVVGSMSTYLHYNYPMTSARHWHLLTCMFRRRICPWDLLVLSQVWCVCWLRLTTTSGIIDSLQPLKAKLNGNVCEMILP